MRIIRDLNHENEKHVSDLKSSPHVIQQRAFVKFPSKFA